MKTAQVLFVVLASCICVSYCKDLIVGTSFNNRLVWQQKAEHDAIPLRKTVKQIYFSDPVQKTLQGIIIRDLDNSDAIPAITAGGIGFPYVTIRLKSGQSSRLNYQIEFYV